MKDLSPPGQYHPFPALAPQILTIYPLTFWAIRIIFELSELYNFRMTSRSFLVSSVGNVATTQRWKDEVDSHACHQCIFPSSSVSILWDGKWDKKLFRNLGKIAQLEDGRVGIQTQGFGRTESFLPADDLILDSPENSLEGSSFQAGGWSAWKAMQQSSRICPW